jgi:hypothetical protein
MFSPRYRLLALLGQVVGSCCVVVLPAGEAVRVVLTLERVRS